jgi:hypothetical protein
MYRIERAFVSIILLLALDRMPLGAEEARRAEPVKTASASAADECVFCHARQPDSRLSSPTAQLNHDAHGQAGIGCIDCHGGDPNAASKDGAHSAQAGYKGQFDPTEIPELCGHCHGDAAYMVKHNPQLPVDQLEKYKTSRHGQLLGMGLRKVATCVSCHTAHNVRTAKDPLSGTYPVNLPRTCAACHSDTKYMAGFPIPTDQFEKFAVSVHGVALLEKEDLASPACNDCHSNHGAVPPGAQSLAHVCGTCHAMNMELFEKSPHLRPFELQELPQCTVCHTHHAIATPTARTFNMEADSVCITCHRKNDAGWQMGKKMFAAYSELTSLQEQAERRLNEAQSLGMDINEGRFVMRDFRSSLFQLRTLSHQLDLKAYIEKAQAAKKQASQAIEVAQGAVFEFHYRRQGLMISVLLFLPVLLLLYLKIRSLGQAPRPGEQHAEPPAGPRS